MRHETAQEDEKTMPDRQNNPQHKGRDTQRKDKQDPIDVPVTGADIDTDAELADEYKLEVPLARKDHPPVDPPVTGANIDTDAELADEYKLEVPLAHENHPPVDPPVTGADIDTDAELADSYELDSDLLHKGQRFRVDEAEEEKPKRGQKSS